MIGRRIALALALSVVVTVVAAVPAFAYFSTSGTGAGTAESAELSALTILPASASPSTALLPGTTADLVLSVTNPNQMPLTIVAVSQGGGVSVVGGSGCTADSAWPTTLGNSGVSIPSVTGLNISVPGGATQVIHLAAAASMTTASAAGCEGATFQIPITVQVVSS